MGLKEAKGQAKKVSGSSNNAESLLKLLQGPDVTGLTRQLSAYVAPLNSFSQPGKENISRTELHKHAKQFVPFLVQLLKLCTVSVAAPSGNNTLAQSKGDEVFSAMEIALDSLDTLRSFLTGSPFEIEIQRCALVRRLLAWRRHSAALAQCRKNYSSLCFHFLDVQKDSHKQGPAAGPVKAIAGQKCVGAIMEKKRTLQISVLPLPQHVEMTSGLPTLVAGIVSDLIWCTGESGPSSSESYQALLPLPRQVEPWLRLLDGGVVEKQRDTLFRGLYKCALVLVANPAQHGVELVQKFSLLTLQHCASSSLWEQYAKVAYKLSHCLSCHGANNILVALELSQVAIKTILEKSELRGLWADIDVLELVDCYARLCQTAKQSVEGWSLLHMLGRHIGQSSPSVAPAVGLYAIGLRFLSEDGLGGSLMPVHGDPSASPKHTSEKVDSGVTCYDLLQGGAGVLESCLQQDAGGVRRKYAFSLLKALDLIKKHSAKYVQVEWASFISESCEKSFKRTTQSSSCNVALQKVLHLWFLLVNSVSSYEELTREEEAVLKKSWSLASAPMVSLFRLSLILQKGVQDCVPHINSLIARSTLQPEELRWIMASVYNMGIQIYNNKDFDSACYPFRVAYDVAWARVALSLQQTPTQPANTEEKVSMNAVVNDLMLDSCVKCMTLADALKRSGKHLAGFEVLSDGLFRWASTHSAMEPHPMKVPSSLVRVWVEMLHTEGSLTSKSVTDEYPCLYTYLRGRSRDLHLRTVGLLMEEELSALDDLEAQDSDVFQVIKEQQLQLLLDNVYMVERFPVERCRIILEKGRLARLRGHYDVASFSEVVSILKTTLEDGLANNSNSSQVAGVENQLAMAYCVQALCEYELDPAGQQYLESIFSALTVWEKSNESQGTWIALDVHSHARVEGQTACSRETLSRLLFSIHDLLALKGYEVVQCRVQQLIVIFSSTVHMNSGHELFASLWANMRPSHVLCPVAYPSGFFSLLSQWLGVAGNSLDFWENCALHCPGTLLDARLQLMCQDFHIKKPGTFVSNAENCSEAFRSVENMALSMFLSSQKSTGGISKLAGLFHMLAEQALDEGNLRVAHKYAKEALNLRLKLVSRMFHMGNKGASLPQAENSKLQTGAAEQSRNKTGRLDVLGSVASLAWPTVTTSARQLESDPSPWRVLGDYIESLMQIGVTSEKMGAVDDAVHSFREGYSLSLAQQMPLAQAAFRSCLGEVHRKRHQWEASENDLTLAKEVYQNVDSAWLCSCCSLAGRASLFLRLGDLARRQGRRDEYPSDDSGPDGMMHSCDALSCYNSAQHSLAAVLDTVKEGCGCTVCAFDRRTVHTESLERVSQIVKEKLPIRRGRPKTQEAVEAKVQEHAPSQAVKVVKAATRGKTTGRKAATKKPKKGDQVSSPKETQLLERGQDMSIISEPDAQDGSAEVIAIREERWSCTVRPGTLTSMDDWTAYKWARYCHQQLARVNIQTGKLYLALGDSDKAVKMYEHAWCICGINANFSRLPTSSESASTMDRRGSFYPIEEAALLYHKSHLHLQRIQFTESGGCHMRGVLPLQWLFHAFNLSTQMPPLLRKISRLLSILHVPIACGGPGLLQTVDACSMSERAAYFHQVAVGAGSRQQHLAVLDSKLMGLLSETDKGATSLSRKMCIAKMQQALTVAPIKSVTGEFSIRELVKGLPCTTLCCISLVDREQASLLERQHTLKSDEASVWVLVTRCSDTFGPVTVLLPAAPLVDDMVRSSERAEKEGCPYNLNDPEDLKLAVDSNTKKLAAESKDLKLSETSLQKIAAAFASILDESRQSTSGNAQIDTAEERRQWWRWRLELDARLLSLLKSMEKSWLGPWKYLLVAEPASASTLEGLRLDTKELSTCLRSSCKVQHGDEAQWEPHDNLIQMLSQCLGSLSSDQVVEGIVALRQWADANFHQLQGSIKECRGDSLQCRVGARSLSETARLFHKAHLRVMQNTTGQLEEGVQTGIAGGRRTRKQTREVLVKESAVAERGPNKTGLGGVDLIATERKPLTLVLDSELQGLPWESLPVLRGFETYRMPSVGSIRALTIHQQLASTYVSCNLQTKQASVKDNKQAHPQSDCLEHTGALEELISFNMGAEEPCVDPYNTFYVLNPSGDLAKTQEAFEGWFREQLGWEGKAGQVPTLEEYIEGLQTHDLYAYLGHGSGDQYLPERFIRRLDRCAAALLMGCSSGRFSPRGDYEPVGVPLSYLMAGCPAAIANLWDVTDGDIDRFSRFLLHKWLGTSNEVDSAISTDKIPSLLTCANAQCTADPCTGIAGGRGVKKNPRSVKKLMDSEKQLEVATSSEGGLTLKMGSVIGKGRDLCRLPYLIGASPVYYGLPTSIFRKELQ